MTRKTDRDEQAVSHITRLLEQGGLQQYEDVVAWQKDLRNSVQDLVALRIEPVMNHKLAEMPHGSLDEKKTLCRWTNDQLRSMNLALRCPITGLPAIFHADAGRNPTVGQFRIELLGKEHGRKRTKTFTNLIPIQITSHPSRPEPLSEYWSRKIQEGTRPVTKLSTNERI